MELFGELLGGNVVQPGIETQFEGADVAACPDAQAHAVSARERLRPPGVPPDHGIVERLRRLVLEVPDEAVETWFDRQSRAW